eukprot:CAMPEP_0194033994 /NCGR_PEP_ID=MMETSP0009_2-20130614/6434_1 /TAXON_ID=210454 /ORGANISM="Grammatophora oceanica, Strain CCMP 410" /LENGTH=835 /DNA_ID=CAMNT_0038674729 /DNA_START=27 /DNA_END=2534 /DNA_ORIENTATION=+
MFPPNGLAPAPGAHAPVQVASTAGAEAAAKQAAAQQTAAAFALAALAPAAQAAAAAAPVHHYIHRRADGVGGHTGITDTKAGLVSSSAAVINRPNTHVPSDTTREKVASQPGMARQQIPSVVAIAPKQAAAQTILSAPAPSQTVLPSPASAPTHVPQQVGNVKVAQAPSGPADPNQATKDEKPLKDKSKLRKGKWTVEEEEYTSRIIHHFSTGVLTLPEGTTLRSYLAEKLNCDPMRITKKFAGASCLGKRVYHLCDRSPGTAADIEMAKAELARLEQRFRLRVEHGQRGVPMPPRIDVLAPMPQSMFAPAAPGASWLQRFASVAAAMSNQAATPTAPTAPAAAAPTIAIAPVAAPGAPATTTLSFPFPPPPPGTQWVATTIPAAAAPGPPKAAPPQPAAPVAPAPAPISVPPPPQIIPGMPPPGSDPVTTWAWAQAAAQLTPAVAQLAAANIQQHQNQLQKAYEAQLQQYSQQSQEQAKQPQPPPQVVQQPAQTHIVHQQPHQQQQQQQQQQQIRQSQQQQQQIRQSQQQQQQIQQSQQQSHQQQIQQSHQQMQQLALQRLHEQMTKAAAPSAAPPSAMQPPQQLLVRQTTAPAPAVPTVTSTTAPMISLPPATRLSQPPSAAPRAVAPVPSAAPTPSRAPAGVPMGAPPAPKSAGRTKEDEAAGTMLVGFLNSLRKGFMEAKDQKDKEEKLRAANTMPMVTYDMRQAPAPAPPAFGFNSTASGTTSHAADSSLEDSASERAKDQSSSEESDRDQYEKTSSGPPRKRIKTKRASSTFTSENVAQHNCRMDALHGTAQRYGAFGTGKMSSAPATAPTAAPSPNGKKGSSWAQNGS